MTVVTKKRLLPFNFTILKNCSVAISLGLIKELRSSVPTEGLSIFNFWFFVLLDAFLKLQYLSHCISFLFIVDVSKWFDLTLTYLPWTKITGQFAFYRSSDRPEVSNQLFSPVHFTLEYELYSLYCQFQSYNGRYLILSGLSSLTYTLFTPFLRHFLMLLIMH